MVVHYLLHDLTTIQHGETKGTIIFGLLRYDLTGLYINTDYTDTSTDASV